MIDADCEADKHRACTGWAWSDDADGWVPCACECHAPAARRARTWHIEPHPGCWKIFDPRGVQVGKAASRDMAEWTARRIAHARVLMKVPS